jgi:uncharacterized RDD family membrane protein YckC
MTFGDEVAIALRRQSQRLDDAVESTVHGWLPGEDEPKTPPDGPPIAYGGLGARAPAFVVDLALASVAFLAVAGAVAFIGWVTGGLSSGLIAELLASFGWLVIVGLYLVFFWTVAGQTPGMRLMSLRVVDPRGERPAFWRSLVRLIGLALAIIPLFAGFLPVLVDSRRRALQDFLAGTVIRTEDVRLPTGGPVATVAQPNGAQRAEQARST